MNILFLSQLLPYPPDAGAKVRSYYLLRYLASRYEVTLVAFTRPDDPPEGIEHLKSLCRAVHCVPMRRSRVQDAGAYAASLLGGESFIIRRDAVPEMSTLLDRLVQAQDFDVIHADQLWMAQYAFRAASQSRRRPRLVLDEHNACFQIFERLAQGEPNPLKRLALEREWRVLRQYEARACARFDHVVTVTDEDREILQGLTDKNGGPGFSTIPICVDTSSVAPVPPAVGSRNVLHLGTMFWPPNIEGVLWFAHRAWPLVQQLAPGATFTIAGKAPSEAVLALAHASPAVQVTGYVPDPRPYLEQAGAFIVPLLSGGGMRVKIVDAWRWGLPVVSTRIGAEGIQVRDGENLLLADRPEDFARAVARVLNDPGLAQALRQNGRQWVEQKYDWERVYPAWDAVYRSEP